MKRGQTALSLLNKVLTALLAIGLGAWLLFGPADLAHLVTAERIERLVASAGIWGPLAVIGLMTLAAVMSPIPDAPIAMAAGAGYGRLCGPGSCEAAGRAYPCVHHWDAFRIDKRS